MVSEYFTVCISNNVRDAETKGKRMSKYDWFNKAKRDIESGRSMYGASEDYKNLPGVESQAQRSNPDEQFAPDSRMSPEEIASQDASAVRGNFQEQVVEGKPSVKRVSELPKSLDDFDKSIGSCYTPEIVLRTNLRERTDLVKWLHQYRVGVTQNSRLTANLL